METLKEFQEGVQETAIYPGSDIPKTKAVFNTIMGIINDYYYKQKNLTKDPAKKTEYDLAVKEISELIGISRNIGLFYVALGLAGEAGEFCEKIKKMIRDNKGCITPHELIQMKKELGDIGWYWSEAARQLQTTLEEITQDNYDKLHSRKERGVLSGSGDNR